MPSRLASPATRAKRASRAYSGFQLSQRFDAAADQERRAGKGNDVVIRRPLIAGRARGQQVIRHRCEQASKRHI